MNINKIAREQAEKEFQKNLIAQKKQALLARMQRQQLRRPAVAKQTPPVTFLDKITGNISSNVGIKGNADNLGAYLNIGNFGSNVANISKGSKSNMGGFLFGGGFSNKKLKGFLR